jgi:hypothetical protein
MRTEPAEKVTFALLGPGFATETAGAAKEAL